VALSIDKKNLQLSIIDNGESLSTIAMNLELKSQLFLKCKAIIMTLKKKA